MAEQLKTVGKTELRKDAVDKVTGKAVYAADIPLENLLYGVVCRSAHHYAEILKIDYSAAEAVPGVLKVLTADDIPGKKTFGPFIKDQPPLADGFVRHLGEPVVLVIAESKAAAEEAREKIKVEYRELEAVFDPVQAADPASPQVHPSGNSATEYDVQDGDVNAGFEDADLVLEETFEVARISPGYMEPENSVAVWNDDETITVWVSSQHPFTDQQYIAETLNMPLERVQVKSAVIGGAFGGKEDPSLSILTALAAWAVQGSVKLVNTRQESFLAHPKRHPAALRIKLGARKDGTFLALEAETYMDTGAYASYGPAVGGLLTETIAGSYRFPNARVVTHVIYTNSPYSGAMRGFGSPQSHFALESMVDMMAEALGINPIDLREKNILRPGDRLFTHVIVNETAESLPICTAKARDLWEEYSLIDPGPGKKAGVGLALAAQSMGLGAKVPDNSTHRLEWTPEGKILVHLGAPDLGQGLATAAEQIAAEALGVPYDQVQTKDLDTFTSPNGSVTCASRMTYMTGNALLGAAEKMIEHLLNEAAEMLDQPRESLKYSDGAVIKEDGSQVQAAEFVSRMAEDGRRLITESTFSFPYPEETTPQHLPIGMPHVLYCFGAQIARVEVDPDLGTVEVTHFAAIHDVGKVISQSGVEGQIEGGVATGLGYALYEDMQQKEEGWVDSFTEYLLPTSKDMPANYQNVILEIAEESGPFGAKGIGEIPLVPTAPAVANAVANAVGVRVKKLPITPEKVLGMDQ